MPMQDSGAPRRENAAACLAVIARSKATKQSRAFGLALDCFASLTMTEGPGSLANRPSRNDDTNQPVPLCRSSAWLNSS
jgi:hypothetical protein